MRYALLEALGELRGVDLVVLCLAFKRWPYVVELELVDDEQLVEVEEIACLKALDNAAQLLGGYLLERVDADLCVGLVGVPGE